MEINSFKQIVYVGVEKGLKITYPRQQPLGNRVVLCYAYRASAKNEFEIFKLPKLIHQKFRKRKKNKLLVLYQPPHTYARQGVVLPQPKVTHI